MLKLLNKYDKTISILVLILSIALSISVFFIPLNPKDLATYGYAGVFIITMLGAATLFIPGPTMIATFAVGALLKSCAGGPCGGTGLSYRRDDRLRSWLRLSGSDITEGQNRYLVSKDLPLDGWPSIPDHLPS